LLSLVILTPLLLLLFLLYDVTGPTWWVWGFLLFSTFQFLMLILYPLVIAPLFNTFVPMENAALLEGIRALAEKVKFPFKGIFVMDGSRRSGHSNAYFTGIGRSKRIVFFDTLVDQLTHRELLAVLAHELGHFKLNHVKLQLLISLGLSALGFYALSRLLGSDAFFDSLGYATPSIHLGIVLLMMLLPPVAMVTAPLFNLLSRKHEYAADAFALDATEDRESLATALIKLNKDNLSVPLVDSLYSFVHHSHPPLAERLLAMERPTPDFP
jgi:STE24 endopeptidase